MAGRRLVVVSERDHNYIDVDDLTLLRVGRAPDSDIVVKDDMVSRRHCQIEVGADGSLRVRDLKSFNGTYLNERRIRDEPLGLWDALRVGRTKMFLVDRIADADAGTDVSRPRTEAPPQGEEPDADAAEADAAEADAQPPKEIPPEEMGKTRTMELNANGEGIGALLSNKEVRAAVEGIVRREREEVERQISRRIRDESGPSVLASLKGFKVRVRRAGPIDGGGDFFDVFKQPLRPHDLAMALGSVSGVGIAACVAATTARHTLRGACAGADGTEPRAVVEALVEVLAHTLHPGSALSLLLADLSDAGKVRVGCMGGTGALHYKAASDEVEVLRPPGRRDEEAVRVVGLEVALRDDDRLILVSDGAGAMRNKAGAPYGAERLKEKTAELNAEGLKPKELLTRLIADYVEFADGSPERDVAIMVVHRVAG